MRQLRIALTIAGAIALGAYEGGALAALLLAAQTACASVKTGEDPPVRIDAIGCASAGAMTGLLAARALLQGYDPVAMMYRAWVQEASVSRMLTGSLHMPLSLAKLEAAVPHLLSQPASRSSANATTPRYHQDRVQLTFALASLQGLDYQIRRLSGITPIDATTYMDWKQFTLEHAADDGDLTTYLTPPNASPAAFAMASGANEFGFPPAKLHRWADRATYERNGIAKPYHWLWYTDGGTLDNEPLGRTLDMSNALDDSAPDANSIRRLHLLIHPQPNDPEHAGIWTDSRKQPAWSATLMRAAALLHSQHLYDDLRRMEKMNAHIAWTDRLGERLTTLLDELQRAHPDEYERWRKEFAALDQGIRHEKHRLSANQRENHEGGEDTPSTAAPPDVLDTLETAGNAALVRRLVREASGIGERHRVQVEVISPLLLLKHDRTGAADNLLAGEILGSFGGFLDVQLRRSDFQLGFLSVKTWMEEIANPFSPDASVGQRDATYEALLREFVAKSLPAVEHAASYLVDDMDALDKAERLKRRPRLFGGLSRSLRALPAPVSHHTARPLYTTQGKRTLISLSPPALATFGLVVLKVGVMVVYELILRSFLDRPVAAVRRLFRRRERPQTPPA